MKTNDKTPTSCTQEVTDNVTDNVTNNAAYSVKHQESVYLRFLPELKAIPAGLVLPVNTDVSTMLSQLRAAQPVLAQHRAQVALLPGFDLARYDSIGEYARVLRYAQARYLSLIEVSDSLPALNAEGVELRDQLLADMQPLVRRGIIPQQRIDELRAGSGYRDTSEDLNAQSLLLRSVWELIKGGTMIKELEIDRAYALGMRIGDAVGDREQLEAGPSEVRDVRARAFTLAANAYEDARHALRFLRRAEGDVDVLLPSLWAQKNAGRPKKSEAAKPGDAPVKPADAPADDKPVVPADTRPLTGKQDSPFSAPVQKP